MYGQSRNKKTSLSKVQRPTVRILRLSESMREEQGKVWKRKYPALKFTQVWVISAIITLYSKMFSDFSFQVSEIRRQEMYKTKCSASLRVGVFLFIQKYEIHRFFKGNSGTVLLFLAHSHPRSSCCFCQRYIERGAPSKLVLPRSAGLHFGGKRVGFSSEREAKSMSLSLLQGDVRNGRTTFNPGFTKQDNKSSPHLVADIRRFLFEEQTIHTFSKKAANPSSVSPLPGGREKGRQYQIVSPWTKCPLLFPSQHGKKRRRKRAGGGDARAAICQGKHRPPPSSFYNSASISPGGKEGTHLPGI